MRTPRPYIKSSLKLDLHLSENVGNEAEKVLTDLSQLLSNNGFRRPNTKQERRKRALNSDISKSAVEKDQDVLTSEKMCAKKSEDKEKRSNFGVIGLRSVLKLLNKSNESGCLTKHILSAILLDSNMLKPTAVAHLIALAALGLSSKAVDQLPGLRATFHQIELSPKTPKNDASSSLFVTPVIRIPKGKSEDKKKMNSKKKKKEKKRLAKKH